MYCISYKLYVYVTDVRAMHDIRLLLHDWQNTIAVWDEELRRHIKG